jgi:hypothetical protein
VGGERFQQLERGLAAPRVGQRSDTHDYALDIAQLRDETLDQQPREPPGGGALESLGLLGASIRQTISSASSRGTAGSSAAAGRTAGKSPRRNGRPARGLENSANTCSHVPEVAASPAARHHPTQSRRSHRRARMTRAVADRTTIRINRWSGSNVMGVLRVGLGFGGSVMRCRLGLFAPSRPRARRASTRPVPGRPSASTAGRSPERDGARGPRRRAASARRRRLSA